MSGYDVLGNIAIVKFKRGTKVGEKKKVALGLMKRYPALISILEKVGKFSGRLRTLDTKFVLGEKTKEALYRENGCVFRFNVDTCYFSPRLAGERNELASIVKKNDSVLVMFGGVGPFAIVIAKGKKAGRVVSVELGKDCCKYAVDNVKRNKVDVEIVQGDVRKKVPKLDGKFDKIVMARPNLKDDFLDVALKKIKKNGMIYYYGFYEEDKLDEMSEMIMKRASQGKKKIKIMKVKKAGDIGVRKFRYRADIKVLN